MTRSDGDGLDLCGGAGLDGAGEKVRTVGHMRVYGFEVEYAVAWLPSAGTRPLDADELAAALFTRVKEWGGGHDIFLPNGGRLYIDTGAHPEYATPECLSVQDVVTHDRAGDLLLRQLAKMAEDRLYKAGLAGRIFVLRNNTDDHGNSWGCHENLMVERRVEVERLVNVLAPYMATRPIWGGAGGLVADGVVGIKYVYSPRIQHIETVAGTSTSQARPLVNLRDESHAGPFYRRLHLLAGDTNMSETQNYTKMGVSGALLQMLEQRRRLPEFNFDTVGFMHLIADDFNLRQKVRTGTGVLYSALDIQDAYCEAVEKQMDKGVFNDENSKAIRLWRGMLEALRRGDWGYLETRVDWVRKRLALDALMEAKRVSLGSVEARYLDFIYHAIDERNAAFEKLHQIHPAITFTDPQSVKKAVSEPPAGRAKARGAFVADVLRQGKAAIIDWERWGYEGEDEMWEILDPAQEHPGAPVLKTEALWESKSAVRANLRDRRR